MARDLIVNGETMVTVKGRSDSGIGSLQQLGLAGEGVQIRFNFKHKDVPVDAWGGPEGPPVDVQHMLADIDVFMDLVHVDQAVLEVCLQESLCGGSGAFGTLPHAGARMGNNLARFAASTTADANGIVRTGNHYIGLNLSSPALAKPYRILYAYMTGPPIEFKLGTERSVYRCNWRGIPYTQDPWNGGLGAFGYVLFDRTPDT